MRNMFRIISFLHEPTPLQIAGPEPEPPRGPVDTVTLRLSKAANVMIVERDQLDHDIRVMVERSRQLGVSIEAIDKALDILHADRAVSTIAKEVADAPGS